MMDMTCPAVRVFDPRVLIQFRTVRTTYYYWTPVLLSSARLHTIGILETQHVGVDFWGPRNLGNCM